MQYGFIEKELQTLLDAMPDAILIVNGDGKIDFVNAQFEIMFGYSMDELLGKSVETLLPKRFSEVHKAHRVRFEREPKVRSMGQGTDLKLVGRRKNRSEFPVEISLSPVKDTDGGIFIIAAVRDVTQRKQAEENLKEKELQLRTLNNNLPNGYTYQIDLGLHGEIRQFIYISDGVEKILGISSKQIVENATRLSERFMEEDNLRVKEVEDLALASMSTFTAESRFIRQDDQVGWMFLTSTPRRLANRHVIWDGIALDITERKQIQEKLEQAYRELEDKNRKLAEAIEREHRLARTDGLTGVSNYRHFVDVATYEISTANRYDSPLSLLLFDVDEFKKVNDDFGHQFGDRVLVNIAKMAENRLRQADVLARYGGEEFIVLLPNTRGEDAYTLAEDLRNHIATLKLENEAKSVSVTVSIDIAEFVVGDDLDSLFRKADKALYKAKESGRNRTEINSD